MASLFTEAAHDFDGGKGVFLPNWEVLLRWVSVLEQRNANLHAQQKEELCQDVLRSRSRVNLAARLPSPIYNAHCTSSVHGSSTKCWAMSILISVFALTRQPHLVKFYLGIGQSGYHTVTLPHLYPLLHIRRHGLL